MGPGSQASVGALWPSDLLHGTPVARGPANAPGRPPCGRGPRPFGGFPCGSLRTAAHMGVLDSKQAVVITEECWPKGLPLPSLPGLGAPEASWGDGGLALNGSPGRLGVGDGGTESTTLPDPVSPRQYLRSRRAVVNSSLRRPTGVALDHCSCKRHKSSAAQPLSSGDWGAQGADSR